MGVHLGETYTNYDQGSIKVTDNETDVALAGNGFFAIAFTNKAGETSVKYTRDGAFTVNTEGYLVTKDGDYVLAEGGNRIQIPNANLVKISVNQAGEIYSGNTYVAKLQLVDFQSYDALSSYGENMYEAVDGAVQTQADATVNQGYLEMYFCFIDFFRIVLYEKYDYTSPNAKYKSKHIPCCWIIPLSFHCRSTFKSKKNS